MPKVICVLDDDELVRAKIGNDLRALGFEAIEVEESRDLRKVLNARPVDAVVVDLVMPDTDGTKVISDVRREWPDVRIIAISGGGRIGPELYLQIARQLGFRVPRTLVSRDPLALRSFATENRFGTICKPIFHGMFADEAASYSIYTRRVTPDSFDADSVKTCPVLLQEEIVRSADVRATFIGPQCFVADISGQPSLVDWRDPDVAVSYSASSLSDEAQRMCRAMLAKLGLIYGAFDFVRTPEGDLVFLEVNPTGEWAWLEDRLGFPMRDALIQLFYGGCE